MMLQTLINSLTLSNGLTIQSKLTSTLALSGVFSFIRLTPFIHDVFDFPHAN